MRWLIGLLAACMLAVPAAGLELEAPDAPSAVSDAVDAPSDSFAQGLWNVLCWAAEQAAPSLTQALRSGLQAVAAVMLGAMLVELCGGAAARAAQLGCTVAVAGILLEQTDSLVGLGVDTVTELSEYGKLLLPVMTAALAAQGGGNTSAAVYAATVFFDSALSSLITRVLVPGVWLYLALCVAYAAVGEPMLDRLRRFVRWGITWALKAGLYVFTGYLSVTGVVSGSVDAAAVRAAKLTVSGAVPVVGGILSDASESVLSGLQVLKSSAGVYGLLTVLALCCGPFLRLGLQYLVLKAAGALCEGMDGKGPAALVSDFAGAMGLVLGMVGTQTVLLLISTVCFMKGVG